MPMTIALYGKSADSSVQSSIKALLDALAAAGIRISLHQQWANILNDKQLLEGREYQTFQNHQDLSDQVKILISIGGDGTFLDTLSLIRDSGIPVLGINTGRLGFLSNTSTDEIKQAVEEIKNETYRIEYRSLLALEDDNNLFEANPYALNEISVLKKDSSSMINIEVKLDGVHLNTYWTDGLIISTSTGSTAYSLSCGGPIIMPGSGNFVITPIAPHNLNVRPIVISDQSVLSLKVEGRSDSHLVALDSRSRELRNQAAFTVKKANHQLAIIQLNNHSFIQSLRNKLNWGLDKRNS